MEKREWGSLKLVPGRCTFCGKDQMVDPAEPCTVCFICKESFETEEAIRHYKNPYGYKDNEEQGRESNSCDNEKAQYMERRKQEMNNNNNMNTADQIRCPKCNSINLQAINQQVVEGKVKDTRRNKGFGCCKGSIGAICLGPIGWLCGLCGMGKTKGKFKDNRKYSNKIIYVCMNCGNQFEI